uniref:Mytilin 4 n=1 Tax=Perna viridis TaxID=73031 RepID=A0A6B9XPN0_PERVI|nr:mytilin 4 [Perna viridis]QVN25580.1 pernalin A [Perna viridis]
MKTAVLLLLVMVPCFSVRGADASCARCKDHCRNKGCGFYMCVLRYGTYYCCCFKCSRDSFFNIGQVDQSLIEDVLEMPKDDDDLRMNK